MSRRKRWLRFGYASVNFGNPVSVKEFCKSRGIDLSSLEQASRFEEIELLGNRLMDEIADVVPVLPVALTCEVMLANESRWLSELEIKRLAASRIEALQKQGAPITIAANACEGVLAAALTMLEGRGFIEASDGLLRANPETRDILHYYANSIAHWQPGN